MNNPDKPIELPEHASVNEVYEAFDLKIPEGACDCVRCRSRAINDAVCHGLIPAKYVLNKFNVVIKCAISAPKPTKEDIGFFHECSNEFDKARSTMLSLIEGQGKMVLMVISVFANRAWVKKHTDRLPSHFTVEFR